MTVWKGFSSEGTLALFGSYRLHFTWQVAAEKFIFALVFLGPILWQRVSGCGVLKHSATAVIRPETQTRMGVSRERGWVRH